jgi:hypothetical protein
VICALVQKQQQNRFQKAADGSTAKLSSSASTVPVSRLVHGWASLDERMYLYTNCI